MNFNQLKGCGSLLNFIKTDREIWEKTSAKVFDFIQLWPWMKLNVIKTGIKMNSLVVSIIIPSSNEIGLYTEGKPAGSKKIFFVCWFVSIGRNHKHTVLSLEYWLDKIKWVYGSLDRPKLNQVRLQKLWKKLAWKSFAHVTLIHGQTHLD